MINLIPEELSELILFKHYSGNLFNKWVIIRVALFISKLLCTGNGWEADGRRGTSGPHQHQATGPDSRPGRQSHILYLQSYGDVEIQTGHDWLASTRVALASRKIPSWDLTNSMKRKERFVSFLVTSVSDTATAPAGIRSIELYSAVVL